MVDFTLTDEQRALREMAHDFAAKEMRPRAWEYDKDGAWPEDVLNKAWELGLMNSHVPEEYGGPGASYLEGAIIEEEIGWGCSGIGTSLSANGLALAPLVLGASFAATKRSIASIPSLGIAGISANGTSSLNASSASADRDAASPFPNNSADTSAAAFAAAGSSAAL